MEGRKPNVADCQFCKHYYMERVGRFKRYSAYYCRLGFGPRGGRITIHQMDKCPKEEEKDATSCEM